ncbi:hypothetical protein BSKO_14146 [Bryopsis sp. KO-2023]|nr:hypothetical protein BSKO_14146 [Bryopsis sp. KO-2023]
MGPTANPALLTAHPLDQRALTLAPKPAPTTGTRLKIGAHLGSPRRLSHRSLELVPGVFRDKEFAFYNTCRTGYSDAVANRTQKPPWNFVHKFGVPTPQQ